MSDAIEVEQSKRSDGVMFGRVDPSNPQKYTPCVYVVDEKRARALQVGLERIISYTRAVHPYVWPNTGVSRGKKADT